MPNYTFYLQARHPFVGTGPDWIKEYFSDGTDNILCEQGFEYTWHQFYPGVSRDIAIDYDIWDRKYRKKLNGDLTFVNNQNQIDYTTLSNVVNTSLEIRVRIEQTCGATTASDWWEGYFSIIDGKWDADRGIFSVTPTVIDDYRDLLEKGDYIYNIKDLHPTVAPKMTYDITVITLAITDPTLVAAGSGAFMSNNPDYPNLARGLVNDSWDYYYDCSTESDLTWKKQIALYKVAAEWEWDAGDGCWSLPSCDDPPVDQELNARGILLTDVIQHIVTANASSMEYKSSFFLLDEWPDGTPYDEGVNNYATGEPNKLANLVLFQKSDVKPTSDPANVANLTFNELMDMLKNIFNVDWFVDELGKFRIEHWSYWDTELAVDTDLTTLDGGKWDRNKNKWTYDTSDMPSTERFSWMEASNSIFTGKDIIYSRIGTRNRYKDNILERTVPVTTDISYVMSNPNDISNDGWVLLQCDVADNVEIEAYVGTGDPYPVNPVLANGHLSWAILHQKYWMHGRVIGKGNMNGQDVTFTSYQKKMKQENMVYPECCGDYDPMSPKKTDMGNGEVRATTYRLIDGTVKSVFFYLDIPQSRLKFGWDTSETYHISKNGWEDILGSDGWPLIWFNLPE